MKRLCLFGVCLLFCGCNTIRFERVDVWPDHTNTVRVVNHRWIWQTQNYRATLTETNASLEAISSGPDADFVRAVTELLTSVGASVAKP